MQNMTSRSMTEIPRLVSIETTNRCNATCSFCPNSRLARDRKTMSDDLFEKIVDDCTRFPLPAIEPFLNGEPFMDPKIISRMEHIRRKLPKTKLRLYSNAYLMTPKRIDEMVDLGIDHLFISLNTLDSKVYKEEMGLNLEKTLSNLAYLTDSKRKSRVAKNITFRMTRTNRQTLFMQDQFIEYCHRVGVKPFIVGLFNYKGDVQSTLPSPGYPCEHITRLDILSSGKSTLCCMDQEGKYGWGDLNTHSVLEVFNSDEARRMKQQHRTNKRKQTPPCSTCNLFWPSFSNCEFKYNVGFLWEAAIYFLTNQPNGRKRPEIPAET